ncbi:MAG TPA: hypothetical protein VF278_04435 [Pirellulales bacterium]
MKRFAIVLGAAALAACFTTSVHAKGHGAGHAHHSGAHHAAHHSGHGAHSSHHAAHKAKSTAKASGEHTTGVKAHPADSGKKPHEAAAEQAATPRVSHATMLSTSRHGYHRGYGHRHYQRNAHYRRHAAQRGRGAFIVGPDQIVPINSGPRIVAPWATLLAAGGSGKASRVAHFQITGDSNPGLFSQVPAVSSAGALSFTPAAGQSGLATLTLVLRSSAGASAPQTFHITVKPL